MRQGSQRCFSPGLALRVLTRYCIRPLVLSEFSSQTTRPSSPRCRWSVGGATTRCHNKASPIAHEKCALSRCSMRAVRHCGRVQSSIPDASPATSAEPTSVASWRVASLHDLIRPCRIGARPHRIELGPREGASSFPSHFSCHHQTSSRRCISVRDRGHLDHGVVAPFPHQYECSDNDLAVCRRGQAIGSTRQGLLVRAIRPGMRRVVVLISGGGSSSAIHVARVLCVSNCIRTMKGWSMLPDAHAP